MWGLRRIEVTVGVLMAATLLGGGALAQSALPAAATMAPTAPTQSSPILDQIRQRGVLRVGTTGDYKPFTFRRPDGHYEGADIDMAASLAKAIGVSVQFVPIVWATLLDDFVAGKYDIAMGGVTIDPKRADKGDFSTTVYVDGKRPIARCADRTRFVSIAAIDQPDVRVIVNPGASNEVFAKANFPRSHLTVHPDNTTIFDEIVAGRADVMVTDGIEVDHQAALHPELCPTAVPAPFTRLEKAYLFPKDPGLKAFVDRWLAHEMESGAWNRTLDAARRTS